jgi:hypothetical protein
MLAGRPGFGWKGVVVAIRPSSWPRWEFFNGTRRPQQIGASDNMTAGSVGWGSVGRAQWTFNNFKIVF